MQLSFILGPFIEYAIVSGDYKDGELYLLLGANGDSKFGDM